MPSLPNVNGVARFTVTGHQGTEKWANIFHIAGLTGPWTQGEMTTAVAQLGTIYSNRFGASLSSAGGLDQVDGIDLTNSTGVIARNTTTHAFTGGAASTSPNVAFVLHWAIARHYRGGHPRTYLPCVQEADVDVSGNVSAGTKGNINAAAALFLSDITTNITVGGVGAVLCAVHYYKDKVLLSTPLVDNITLGTCRNVVGTQRRRLPKIT